MSPLTILFLDHAPALGGAERSLLLLLKHLDRDQWQPHLVCQEGLLAQAAKDLGVATHIVPMPRLRRSLYAPLHWLRAAHTIASLARQVNAALLVANTVRAALYTAPAAHLARRPFVWHMRDLWLSESQPHHLWVDRIGKQLLCATAARVIANSHATAAHLPCHGQVTVIHNGIEVERYDPRTDGNPFRQRYNIPLDAPLVGTVGRLRPWKGQDRFLRALARVRETVPQAQGVIVGGTPFGVKSAYPLQLRRLADELHLNECVVFTGHLDDVRPALAAMDVFVHPGDPEPFGLVNIEAMAMGKPVVAFSHGALPEIVIHGETGLLAEPGNEEALARMIVRLLLEPDLRDRLAMEARRRAVQCFSVEQSIPSITKAFRSAAATQSRRNT